MRNELKENYSEQLEVNKLNRSIRDLMNIFKEMFSDIFYLDLIKKSNLSESNELCVNEPRGNVYTRIGGELDEVAHNDFVENSDYIIANHRVFVGK